MVIEDLKAVLICLSALKDLSAEQLVTGGVHKMLIKALMFRYIAEVCLIVVVGLNVGLSDHGP